MYTLGCKVNQYETQVMRERFNQAGFKELEDKQPADFYVINTCTVTHRADSESLNFIRRAKRENPGARIIVTGCLTELDENKIKEVNNEALVIKNKDKEKISHFLDSLNRQTSAGISYFKGHTRAFLKIQDGCNNFCSYCKVPLVRGPSCSRPLNEIIQEAERLVRNGYKEIVLTGICLGSFGKDLSGQINLNSVLEELEKIDGLKRVRLSSIEMGDVTDTLINKIAKSEKLCRHLHIPLQSGDNEILRKMNRNYTRTEYLNLVKKIKSRIPGVAITTDVLVGFPGETKVNFQNTVDLIKKTLPFKIHIFPYSRRGETPAAINFSRSDIKVPAGIPALAGKDELKPGEIKERVLQLKKLEQGCAFRFVRQFFNKTIFLLIEGQFKESPGTWYGYTDNYIKVKIKSSKDLKNQIINCRFIRKNWVTSNTSNTS